LSVFYPSIGTLAGYLGSVSALFCVYVLPTVTYLKYKYTEVKNPFLAYAIRENKFTVKSPPESKKSDTSTSENSNERYS
jgi:hypothetical protein